ncbi:uncharacterized protein JCM6883_005865 [Sporobolomyces salmoneus]|uniref:uncharacterized protein n=1 Tax=Sporobolomyces salmoneus TaxID=183962 RepID=UPI00317A2A8D
MTSSSSTSIASLDPLSPEAPTKSTSTSSVGKELLAGTVAGWAQVIVGQPFDIVKVRLQAGNVSYGGPVDCAKQLLKNEGASGFYKGTTMPLVGIGACVCVQFACLQAGKRFFVSQNASNGFSSPSTLTPLQFYLSGAFAGLGNSLFSGPVEHIRIRLQTQPNVHPPLYSGPLDALRKIYRSDRLRGIYQGQGATFAREAHGYGVYFAVYELLVAREIKKGGLSDEVSLGKSAVFGAAAGWGMWLLNYPLDVLKSRIQTDSFPSSGARNYPRGMRDAIPALYKEGGAGAFFRGLTPTMIRHLNGESLGLPSPILSSRPPSTQRLYDVETLLISHSEQFQSAAESFVSSLEKSPDLDMKFLAVRLNFNFQFRAEPTGAKSEA